MFKKYIEKRKKRKLIKDLLKKYDIQYTAELIMEKWLIKLIQGGNTAERESLKQKQLIIKRTKSLMDFLAQYLKDLK